MRVYFFLINCFLLNEKIIMHTINNLKFLNICKNSIHIELLPISLDGCLLLRKLNKLVSPCLVLLPS